MRRTEKNSCKRLYAWVLFVFAALSAPAWAMDQPVMSMGQTVYVPVYSNVFSGPKANPFQLAAMVSIRNTDPKDSITILRADYYDNEGRMIESHMKEAKKLGPLASTHIYIKEYDTKGGPGANFIIQWQAKGLVNEPIIETLMLGLKGGQGISFMCPAKVIEARKQKE
ncbi:MAG: DUF3124 domain-containing protein [Desulfatibacillum sp.]|nr:DUF3124 domain-containing protein [Desulfatibacillum sp.]